MGVAKDFAAGNGRTNLVKKCIVKSCPYEPVILDAKSLTKWRDDDGFALFDVDEEMLDGQQMETWFCLEHARDYLFPLIDQMAGNTTGQILKEFKHEGYF